MVDREGSSNACILPWPPPGFTEVAESPAPELAPETASLLAWLRDNPGHPRKRLHHARGMPATIAARHAHARMVATLLRRGLVEDVEGLIYTV